MIRLREKPEQKKSCENVHLSKQCRVAKGVRLRSFSRKSENLDQTKIIRNRIGFVLVWVHLTKPMNILFRFVSVFPMYFKTTKTNSFVSKLTKSNRKFILKQPKQTDLFQNELKQTENDLKNIKSKKNFCGIKKFVQISICELSI